MVDVTAKNPTVRQASAVCRVDAHRGHAACVTAQSEGDVLAVARVAGISAAKRVPELLPSHTRSACTAARWT